MEPVKKGDKYYFETDWGGHRKFNKPLACKECPLFKRSRIPHDLREFKQVLAIGEGPDIDELVKNTHLIGGAGTVIRETVQDTGLFKFGVGYTNVAQCFGFEDLKWSNYDRALDALDICQDLLWNLIDDIKPNLLLVLGDIPKQYLIPDERLGIEKIAGIIYDCDENLSMLPAYNPAHVLRNPKKFERFWDQINEGKLFFQEVPGPFEWRVGTRAAIEYLKTKEILWIDAETTSFNPWDNGYTMGYNPATKLTDKLYPKGQVLCFSVSGQDISKNQIDDFSYVFTMKLIKQYYRELYDLFFGKPTGCFNSSFDIIYFRSLGFRPKLVEDPLLGSFALDETPGHGLKRISRRLMGVEDWSAPIHQYLPNTTTSYAAIPPRVLIPYNGLDTPVLPYLDHELKSRMDENEKKIYYNNLMEYSRMFCTTRERGIRIDAGRLYEVKKFLEDESHVRWRELQDNFGVKNPNSPVQISKKIFELGICDFEPATSRESLGSLLGQCKEEGYDRGIKFLELIREYREYAKALGTYVVGKKGILASMDFTTSLIHPDINLLGTVTGRLGITWPALLTFPSTARLAQALRSVFVPFPGKVWCHWDQKQFELRVYAVVNDDKALKDLFRDPNRDPHAETGYKVYSRKYNVGIEDGKRLYLEADSATKGQTRVIIKSVNFGRIYLRTAVSIADGLGIPLSEAEMLCEVIDSLWPDVIRYRNNIEKLLNEEQEIVTVFGRKRRFPIITNDNYMDCLREACNFPIQSTANEMNLMGMNYAYKEYYEAFADGDDWILYPMFSVHDAVEAQVAEGDYDRINKKVQQIFAEIPSKALNITDFEFKSDAGVGYTWAEASLKS